MADVRIIVASSELAGEVPREVPELMGDEGSDFLVSLPVKTQRTPELQTGWDMLWSMEGIGLACGVEPGDVSSQMPEAFHLNIVGGNIFKSALFRPKFVPEKLASEHAKAYYETDLSAVEGIVPVYTRLDISCADPGLSESFRKVGIESSSVNDQRVIDSISWLARRGLAHGTVFGSNSTRYHTVQDVILILQKIKGDYPVQVRKYGAKPSGDPREWLR